MPTTKSIQSSDKLLRAVKYFREVLNSSQPALQHLEMFLAVAEEDGITQIQLQARLDSIQGTVSRNVKKLSTYLMADPEKPGRKVLAGPDLLESRPAKEVKQNGVYLSKNGKKVLAEIQKILG